MTSVGVSVVTTLGMIYEIIRHQGEQEIPLAIQAFCVQHYHIPLVGGRKLCMQHHTETTMLLIAEGENDFVLRSDDPEPPCRIYAPHAHGKHSECILFLNGHELHSFTRMKNGKETFPDWSWMHHEEHCSGDLRFNLLNPKYVM